MKRVKTNGIVAFLFCVCVLMCSISCVMGLERDKIYQAPDLMLTQGQAKYNLYDGIEYDEKKYDLTVCNQGGFDINKPGSYTVEYMLTPLKTSSDFEPDREPGGSGAAIHQETSSARESAGTDGTAESQTFLSEETSATPAAEATAGTDTSAAASATSAPETAAGTEETSAPEATTGTEETSAASAPEATAGTEETSAASATPVSEAIAGTDAAAAASAAAVSETAAGTKETSPASAVSAAAGEKETSAPKDTAGVKGISAQKQAQVQETVPGQDKTLSGLNTIKIQGNSIPRSTLFMVNTSDEDTWGKPAAVRMVNKTFFVKEGVPASAGSLVTIETPAPEGTSSAQETAAPRETTAPKDGTAALPATTAPKDTAPPSESTAPPETTAPKDTAALEASTAPTETAAPEASTSSGSASAPEAAPVPEESAAQGTRPAPDKASASQAVPSSDPVSFSRTIVVREAVQYEDTRFDINTVSDPLTGMDYDKAHYNLSVLDDGGFNGSRINEYHIIYRLINTDNGKMVADLERYIWITVPGVEFDAPDLQLHINQSGYNLQEGITYNSFKYVLTTIAPDRLDISAAGKQRVMFCLTAAEGSIPDAASLEATPSQAKSSTAQSETIPIAAIFGRSVMVETGPVVVINAPPLVIVQGAVTSRDLLEGVTAKDEDGNPVTPQVASRSELDLAAEKAASGQKDPEEPDLFPSSRSFFLAGPVGETEDATKSDALPAAIPAGEYKVTISAVHPVTGVVFTMERDVEVRAAAVRLDYPAGSGKVSEQFGSLGSAIDAVKADNPKGGPNDIYTLSLLQNYSLTEADVTEFGKAVDMPADTTVVLTGPNPASVSPYGLALTTNLILPRGSAGVTGAAFEFKNMFISGTGKVIAANGSKLTMGTGLIVSQQAYISLIGGIYESGNVAKDLTFNGNTCLDIRSGNYDTIVGGNWHYWDKSTEKDSPATSTVNGNTTVHIGGGNGTNIISKVYGGSYLAGGNATYTAAQRNGNSTVTLSGGMFTIIMQSLCAGSGGAYPDMIMEDSTSEDHTSQISLEGGNCFSPVRGTAASKGSGRFLPKQGDVELRVTGNRSVGGNVCDFEAVRLTPGSSLSVGGNLCRTAPFTEDTKPAMLLDFQGNAKLSLSKSTGNTAGSFRIQGEGNTLTLPRIGAASAPLTLDGNAPNVRVDNARLALLYQSGETGQFEDKLLYFNPIKRNAEAADYSLPGTEDFAVLSNKTTGYVYLGRTVTMQEAGGEPQFYVSLAKAMDAIGRGTGSYTVTIRKEGYDLTQEDGIALATQGSNAKKIIFTSRFKIAADDPMEPGEHVGDDVTRTIMVGAGKTAKDPPSDLFLNAPVDVIHDMKLDYLQEGCSLYSNGHTLTVGPSVEIISDAGYYPVLYGGAKDRKVPSTNMTLLSGRYGAIYGGGQEVNAPITGDALITFGGDAELHGPMYGGGRAGAVGGAAKLEIIGGRAMAADAVSGAKNEIVGGGGTGAVGNVDLTISGGIANGTIEIAGCDSGNVGGNVNINIKEAVSAPAPKAPLGNLYGASLRDGAAAGTVGGNIHITITNGKDYGTIRGGKSGLSGAGQSDITFKSGSVKVTNIMDFDALNLGEADIPADKATLFLTGKLQGRDGDLNFWGGSVLTLQGTSTDPADLVVKNLHTDATPNWSHLHMYKGPGADQTAAVSRPLTIAGANTSDPGNKLVLGEYGSGGAQERDTTGDRGDKLLRFEVPANANTLDYVSDIQGLDIVRNAKDAGVVELGAANSPKISLERVRHTTAAGAVTQADSPGTTVLKTLSFKIESFRDEAPAEPGGAIKSAYVSTSQQADSAWRNGGAIPAGGKEITVTPDAADPIRWNGTVTMDIAPPKEPSPEYYYAHVRDENNKVDTIILDVHSPDKIKSPEISRDGDGDYTFKMEIQDSKPVIPVTPGLDINYNVSGLRQLAWAIGPPAAAGQPPAGQEEALAAGMTEGAHLKEVLTMPAPTIESYLWTFKVPAKELGNPADRVVYLYAKDAMGNTAVYSVPLNENVINVQFPTSVGTMALRGGSQPSLISPNLYLVNLSDKPVKAELVSAEIPPGQGTPGDKKLLLTDKRSGPWASNELNLMVKPIADGLGNCFFPTISVKDINPLTGAVDLGIMPDKSQENHGASFTFGALYDKDNIIKTSGWSQCVLAYRFSLVPSPPDSGSPAPDLVLKAEMKGGEAGG